LLAKSSGRGRALAAEILLCNAAVRALIRDDKVHQIYSIIQTSGQMGMKTMTQSLVDLYRTNVISYEEALSSASDRAEFQRLAGASSHRS
jgi:twitching motility protein PilT